MTWFSGGLRVLDITNPYSPREVGYYVPQPGKGQKTVKSNDVFRSDNGLLYLTDRYDGLEILESQLCNLTAKATAPLDTRKVFIAFKE